MEDARLPSRPLELWAGVECTVNRIDDEYVDQLELTGHASRLDDLDRFASLGIGTLRYPILWERTAPRGSADADWTWPDARLGRITDLGMRPVVGLVHHGSGPLDTSLIDPAWPVRLAAYAGAVAARYPWVSAYTPVNEPLTTARFSGLYGLWFPHGCSDAVFVRAMINETRATVLSMREIRRVNSEALLVQTEDLSYVRATPGLQYQADFENERRWLTFDLLCGTVGRQHPLFPFLTRSGIAEAELSWFAENPCPPDVIGFNYYVTSERFLDGAVSGPGNGRRSYRDREAARACGLAGIATLLGQAHRRFGLPMAITEAHLGGTRDEQLRWLLEMWEGAQTARSRGVDVRAVTVWSLLGAYDWDSLCTRRAGHYEPGVYDVRGPTPRPTALAGAVRALAAGNRPSHPVLQMPGWWRR